MKKIPIIKNFEKCVFLNLLINFGLFLSTAILVGNIRVASANPVKSPEGSPKSLITAEKIIFPKVVARETITREFLSHDIWIGKNLLFPPFEQIRTQLEKVLARKLKNRGEAHITLLTPPEFFAIQAEFKAASKTVTVADIEKVIGAENLQTMEFELVCVGGFKRKVEPFDETFYVVVKSQNLLNLRIKIRDFVTKEIGKTLFVPENFAPHITLGFDQNDMHDKDGAKKDASSCRYYFTE